MEVNLAIHLQCTRKGGALFAAKVGLVGSLKMNHFGFFFFEGCNIRGGPKNGIHFTYSSEGRPSGECFVELVSLEDMEK